MHSRLTILTAAAGGFLLGLAFIVGIRDLGSPRTSEVEASTPEPADDLLPQQPVTDPTSLRRTVVVEAVARTAPAVVAISTEVPTQSPFVRLGLAPQTTTSQGSGVVIRADGVVLTNAHVVSGAVSIKATFSDKTSYPATVLGLDDALDLAVLRLEGATTLPHVPLGTSSDLLLGEPVIAIGNPFGLGHTVTTGVISSASRTLEVSDRVYQDYIQTDAGINPGNSGGPLLNLRGELIGINTAIRRDAENIGFAIPIDRAAKVARDLLRYGSVRSPWLGICVEDVGGPRYSGTPIEAGAILVTRVDSPQASQAGLTEGDVILEVDGRPIHSRDDLNVHLASRKPGATVQVTGLRKNNRFQVSMVADTIPAEWSAHLLADVLGISVTPLDSSNNRTYGFRQSWGLVVVKALPKGSFASAGLRPGDLIVTVNGVAVRTEDDLKSALAQARSSHRATVLLQVQRGPHGAYVKVDL